MQFKFNEILLQEELMPAYLASKAEENENMPEDDENTITEDLDESVDDGTASISSRPTTATSVGRSRPATATSHAPPSEHDPESGSGESGDENI